MKATEQLKASAELVKFTKQLCDKLELADITNTSLELSPAEVHIVVALIEARLTNKEPK